jgi:hypothetical protein
VRHRFAQQDGKQRQQLPLALAEEIQVGDAFDKLASSCSSRRAWWAAAR